VVILVRPVEDREEVVIGVHSEAVIADDGAGPGR
jgi:hypothetical protein